MSQYKPDGINYPLVNVTNGSADVVIPGYDATAEIGEGDWFYVDGVTGFYQVGATAPIYSAGNTTVVLTSPYSGVTAAGATGVFHRDFTSIYGLPLLNSGDLEAPALWSRAMQLLDSALSSPILNGNLTFNGNGRRILGDFSNATHSNRVMFQTSTANGSTIVGILPNGTGNVGQFNVYNSSDVNNATVGQFSANSSDVRIISTRQGTGSYLPMTFHTNGTEKLRIGADATGTFTFGGTAPRILGDFSNATVSSRVLLQTSTTNGTTSVGVIPNGTATSAGVAVFNGADSDNSSYGSFVVDAANTSVYSAKTGTGSYLPLRLVTSGTPKLTIGADLTGTFTFGGTAPRIIGDFSDATPANRVLFQTSSSNSITSIGIIPSGTSNSSLFTAFSNSDPNNSSLIQVGCDSASGISYINSNKNGTGNYLPMVFYTSITERMRIGTDGHVLVGLTSNLSFPTTTAAGIDFDSTNGAVALSRSGGGALACQRTSSDGITASFWRQTTQVGSISVTASATAYNTSSDHRLKDNQQPLTGSGEFIDSLKPKTWEWTVDGTKATGFIAHEVQEVSPSSVHGEKDAVDEEGNPVYQAMEYGSAEFIANIIAELQDLRKRVKELEDK